MYLNNSGHGDEGRSRETRCEQRFGTLWEEHLMDAFGYEFL